MDFWIKLISNLLNTNCLVGERYHIKYIVKDYLKWSEIFYIDKSPNSFVFRNCLVGKCYHIKICDFGSDCATYKKDYVEMENLLLVPLRWMAWESVIEVMSSTILIIFNILLIF